MHHKMSDEEMAGAHSASDTSPQTAKMRCAKCHQSFVVVDRKLMPFCSLRCQQLDLANWLDEDYGLPFEGDKSGQDVEFREDDFAE